MEYVVTIDISTLIWNETDYQSNASDYYKLVYHLPNLLKLINDHEACVLMREELKTQILAEFPYSITDQSFRDFQNLTIAFLTQLGTRMIVYPQVNNQNISVTPQIIRHFYSNNTKDEISYLITRIHSIRTPDSKFFTFSYFWPQKNDLTTSIQKDTLKVETICIDDEQRLKDFFTSKKPTFEHNPKHNLYKSGGKVGKLSCYNERLGDKTKAQNLLNSSTKFGEAYYNFDAEHGVYVAFFNTQENIYHGYDDNTAPDEVRRHFNK